MPSRANTTTHHSDDWRRRRRTGKRRASAFEIRNALDGQPDLERQRRDLRAGRRRIRNGDRVERDGSKDNAPGGCVRRRSRRRRGRQHGGRPEQRGGHRGDWVRGALAGALIGGCLQLRLRVHRADRAGGMRARAVAAHRRDTPHRAEGRRHRDEQAHVERQPDGRDVRDTGSHPCHLTTVAQNPGRTREGSQDGPTTNVFWSSTAPPAPRTSTRQVPGRSGLAVIRL